MAVVLKWHGDKFNHALRNATAEGLARATAFFHHQCRAAVSKPNTGERKKGGRGKNGRFKKSRTVYSNPSKPGEPPRLRTGFGQRNVLMEFDRSRPAGRVGVGRNAMYMFFLEIGTRKVARRPWLLATLQQHQTTIGKLAAIGGKDKVR